jgi:hypothetical protein
VFDQLGSAIALGIFALAVAATTFRSWPAHVEFTAVALSILANWLTAMKIIWCWPVWMATNVLFAALFYDAELWGLFHDAVRLLRAVDRRLAGVVGAWAAPRARNASSVTTSKCAAPAASRSRALERRIAAVEAVLAQAGWKRSPLTSLG